MESCWCKAPLKTCIVGCISTHPGEAMPNPWKELSIGGKEQGYCFFFFFWSDCTPFIPIFLFNMSERETTWQYITKERVYVDSSLTGKRCAYTRQKSSGVWQLSSKYNYDYMINRIVKGSGIDLGILFKLFCSSIFRGSIV